MTELLLQIGDIDGAKKKDVSQEEEMPEGENTTRRLNKVKTIMSRATEDLKKPEDELLGNICSDIAANLPL